MSREHRLGWGEPAVQTTHNCKHKESLPALKDTVHLHFQLQWNQRSLRTGSSVNTVGQPISQINYVGLIWKLKIVTIIPKDPGFLAILAKSQKHDMTWHGKWHGTSHVTHDTGWLGACLLFAKACFKQASNLRWTRRELLLHIWDWEWETTKPIPNFWD